MHHTIKQLLLVHDSSETSLRSNFILLILLVTIINIATTTSRYPSAHSQKHGAII